MLRYFRVYFSNFHIDVTVEHNLYDDKEQKKANIKNAIQSEIKIHHANEMHDIHGASNFNYIYGISYNDRCEDIVWEQDKRHYMKRYKIKKVEKLSPCEGCRLNAPGQRDHMDIGGCLYQSDSDSDY